MKSPFRPIQVPKFSLRELPRLGLLVRRHFMTGVLVVIPMAVILSILVWALGIIWSLHGLLPSALRPEAWIESTALVWFVNMVIAGSLAIILALVVSVVGWASQQILGQKILEFLAQDVISRIPVLRSVYSGLDQLMQTMAQGGGQQFNRVVYVEYPRKGMWTLAFVTGPTRATAHDHIFNKGHLNIYVPTTPNPTSGFYLIVHESEVQDSHMKVEEAFKVILSLGIAQGTSTAHTHHGARDGR